MIAKHFFFHRLDLSYNFLTKIPVTTVSSLAALSVCILDLSYNSIPAISTTDLSNKFRVIVI